MKVDRQGVRRNRAADISGRRYGMLVADRMSRAVPRSCNPNYYYYYWTFRCDCGGEYTGRSDVVTGGSRTDCGCLKRQESIRRADEERKQRGRDRRNKWRNKSRRKARERDMSSSAPGNNPRSITRLLFGRTKADRSKLPEWYERSFDVRGQNDGDDSTEVMYHAVQVVLPGPQCWLVRDPGVLDYARCRSGHMDLANPVNLTRRVSDATRVHASEIHRFMEGDVGRNLPDHVAVEFIHERDLFDFEEIWLGKSQGELDEVEQSAA